jgi:hypothetical protein
VTQNPKTETEKTRGKLGQESVRGDKDDAQEGSHGRADRGRFAASGSGSQSSRDLPQGGDQPGDLLSLEAAYSGVAVSELRELRQLREENGRLKRLIADPHCRCFQAAPLKVGTNILLLAA